MSRAQVPIIGALAARLQRRNEHGEAVQLPGGIPTLAGLESEKVDEYLETNLYWRVTSV
jgi:hypothetical protein